MYNQHIRGMATTRHRSLVERGGRKALLDTLHTHTKKIGKKNIRKNPIFTNLNNRFEYVELPAKLLDHFLRSNKSNTNQSSENVGFNFVLGVVAVATSPGSVPKWKPQTSPTKNIISWNLGPLHLSAALPYIAQTMHTAASHLSSQGNDRRSTDALANNGR